MPKNKLSLNTKDCLELLRKGATAYWGTFGPYLITKRTKSNPQITYNIHLKSANCLLRNGVLSQTKDYPKLAFKDIPFDYGEPKLPRHLYTLKPARKRYPPRKKP